VSEKTAETTKAELQRRRRTILETSRRADAEIEALRAAERVSEFEEGAQSEHEQFTLSRLSETQRQEIAQIDAALARLDAGEYGICRDCSGDIDPRRLAALPYALLCTECASHRERAPGVAPPVPEQTGR
jgi:DnaK suppressor protein